MMQTVLQHLSPYRNTNRAGLSRGAEEGALASEGNAVQCPPIAAPVPLLLRPAGNQVPGCLPRPATAPNREQWPPSFSGILPTHQNTGPCSPNSPDFQGQSECQVGDTLDCCLFLSQNDLATDPGRLHNSRKSYHFLKALAHSRNCLSLGVLDCLPHKDRKGKITGIHKYY